MYVYIYRNSYETRDYCGVSGEQGMISMVEVRVVHNSCERRYTGSLYRGIIGIIVETIRAVNMQE